MITQPAIRHQMINRRSQLDQSYVDQYVSIFNNKILEFIKPYSSIGLYFAVRNEISVDRVIQECSKERKLSLPRVNQKDELEFVHFEDKNLGRVGKYGIPEPVTNVIDYIPEIFIVPLVAIDHLGTRVGMGKGYYDRYLQALIGRSIFVAVGWDFQLQDEILVRKNHDVPMNYFISPSEYIEF